MTTAATDLVCDWRRPLSPLDCRSLSIKQPEYFPGLQYTRAVNEVIYIAAGGGAGPSAHHSHEVQKSDIRNNLF